MNRSQAAVTALLLVGAVAFFSSCNAHAPEAAQRELALGFALRVVGGLVSAVTLAGLFGQWWEGAELARMSPGGAVVLGGVLVASPSWGAALAFAGLLAAALVAPRGHPPQD